MGLEIAEIFMDIEDEFSIIIVGPHEISTLGDLVDFVHESMLRQNGDDENSIKERYKQEIRLQLYSLTHDVPIEKLYEEVSGQIYILPHLPRRPWVLKTIWFSYIVVVFVPGYAVDGKMGYMIFSLLGLILVAILYYATNGLRVVPEQFNTLNKIESHIMNEIDQITFKSPMKQVAVPDRESVKRRVFSIVRKYTGGVELNEGQKLVKDLGLG